MKKINLYLTYLLVFLLPTYLIRFEIFNIPTTILEIFIYILFALTLISAISSKTIRFIKNKKLLIVIAIFLLVFLPSLFFSQDKVTALGQYKAFIFDPLLVIVIFYENIDSTIKLKKLINYFIYSGIYVSIYSIYQYLTGQTTSDGRIIGLFGYSPNYTAFYLLPVAIFYFFDLTSGGNKKIFLKLIKYLGFLLILLALYLTYSRAAIIALIGSLIFGYFVKYIVNLKLSKIIKTLAIILAIVIMFFAAFGFLKPDYMASDDAGRISSSNNIRWEIYKTTAYKILPKDNNWLFGVGLGNYQNYFTDITVDQVNYPEYISPKALTAHNLFLHTLAVAGFLALATLIYFLINFFTNLKVNNKLYFCAFIVLLAMLIQGSVDTIYYKNDLSIIFWLVLFIGLFYEFKDKKFT